LAYALARWRCVREEQQVSQRSAVLLSAVITVVVLVAIVVLRDAIVPPLPT
jgi:hypothetical protein